LAAVLVAAAAGAAEAVSLTRVEAVEFGRTPEGEAVRLFTLRSAGGMVAKIMERGATVTELWAPGRDGKLANVLFGSDKLDAYLSGFNASASVMGRVANRIAYGRFTLDGVSCQVVTNRGPHFLHGGKKGFASAVWRGEALPPQARAASVRFSHTSRDGDDGFPGTVEVSVTYTLTDANELWLEYAATADKPTPLNLTNHAYFNLAGAGVGDVCGTLLWVAADKTTRVDGLLIPTGELADVKGTPLDFTAPLAIGSRIAQLEPPFTGYDHNYVLRGGGKGLALAGWAYEAQSGRAMQVLTTEPGMQVFTPKRYFGPDGKPLADVSALKHNAFCFETQHFPDSVNHPEFPSTILRPGQMFASTTVFRFSVQQEQDAAQRLMLTR
jgi:aldose 1-epimerase